MKDAVLLELANRWESDAQAPVCENGAEEAKLRNAAAQGIREGKRECADALRVLIQLFGDKNSVNNFSYKGDRL